MLTRAARVREVGFDTIEVITDSAAAALAASGLTFGIRTIENLTAAEIARLHAAGIDVAWYSRARISDWSADSGARDGAAAAAKAKALGLPMATSAGCDLEGKIPSAAAAIDYANGWYKAALAAGLTADAPLLYVGAGTPLDAAALFHKIGFRRYWKSLSDVPTPAERGYCLLQLFPANQHVGGAFIDYNVVQQDYLGGLPTFATGGV